MLQLITNRTAQDVFRWQELKSKGWENMTAEERAEWTGDPVAMSTPAAPRGSYNHTDLNRVESAVEYLAERLRNLGYPVERLYTRRWASTDVPTVADMTRYLNNVKVIRESFVILRTTPGVPGTMKNLDLDDANAIERILADVDVLVDGMVSNFAYSGDIFGGEL